MLPRNILIRSQGTREVSISWTSQTAETRSFVFINSKLVVGSYRAETINRSIVFPVPTEKTYKIEVFDVTEDETIPYSMEESLLVQPLLSWNAVENAVAYKIYHTIFDTSSIESLLVTIPARLTGKIKITKLTSPSPARYIQELNYCYKSAGNEQTSRLTLMKQLRYTVHLWNCYSTEGKHHTEKIAFQKPFHYIQQLVSCYQFSGHDYKTSILFSRHVRYVQKLYYDCQRIIDNAYTAQLVLNPVRNYRHGKIVYRYDAEQFNHSKLKFRYNYKNIVGTKLLFTFDRITRVETKWLWKHRFLVHSGWKIMARDTASR
ncbi:MAG: hypothetical protein LBK82_16265 [Planctomycetaceae bacterium]|jgi:hypothetical protein|nr:hypothetical protein [Planctomycetaceae bacterium]